MGIVGEFLEIDPEGEGAHITELDGLAEGEVLRVSDTEELVRSVEGESLGGSGACGSFLDGDVTCLGHGQILGIIHHIVVETEP